MSRVIQLYSDKNKTQKAYPVSIAKEVYLDDGSTDVMSKFTSVDESISSKAPLTHNHTYTNSTPTVNDFGGIKNGSTFDNIDIKDLITSMLYPYVAPTISLSSSPNGGYFEQGTSRSVSSVNVSVRKKSNTITSVQLKLNASTIITKTGEEVANGVTFTQTESIPQILNQSRFSVSVVDSSGETSVLYGPYFTPVYPFFSSASLSGAVTTETIASMTKSLGVKGTKTLTFTTSNTPITFVYPKSWGSVRQVLDPNGFDITASFTTSEASLDMADNTTQLYNVYRNNVSTVSSFTLRFIF